MRFALAAFAAIVTFASSAHGVPVRQLQQGISLSEADAQFSIACVRRRQYDLVNVQTACQSKCSEDDSSCSETCQHDYDLGMKKANAECQAMMESMAETTAEKSKHHRPRPHLSMAFLSAAPKKPSYAHTKPKPVLPSSQEKPKSYPGMAETGADFSIACVRRRQYDLVNVLTSCQSNCGEDDTSCSETCQHEYDLGMKKANAECQAMVEQQTESLAQRSVSHVPSKPSHQHKPVTDKLVETEAEFSIACVRRRQYDLVNVQTACQSKCSEDDSSCSETCQHDYDLGMKKANAECQAMSEDSSTSSSSSSSAAAVEAAATSTVESNGIGHKKPPPKPKAVADDAASDQPAAASA